MINQFVIKRPKSYKQMGLDSYFKVARQAENNETDDTHENTTDINPVPNVICDRSGNCASMQ